MGNLLTLTDAKTYLQITTTASDSLISLYIDLIEAELSRYVRYELARNTYTEALAYLGETYDESSYTPIDAHFTTPALYLKNIPVISLTLTAGGEEVSQDSYSLNVITGVIEPDSQLADVTATYVAGYTTSTLPTALKSVLLEGVRGQYERNAAAVAGKSAIKSERIKDYSITYADDTLYAGSANSVKTYIQLNKHILNSYRKVSI